MGHFHPVQWGFSPNNDDLSQYFYKNFSFQIKQILGELLRVWRLLRIEKAVESLGTWILKRYAEYMISSAYGCGSFRSVHPVYSHIHPLINSSHCLLSCHIPSLPSSPLLSTEVTVFNHNIRSAELVTEIFKSLYIKELRRCYHLAALRIQNVVRMVIAISVCNAKRHKLSIITKGRTLAERRCRELVFNILESNVSSLDISLHTFHRRLISSRKMSGTRQVATADASPRIETKRSHGRPRSTVIHPSTRTPSTTPNTDTVVNFSLGSHIRNLSAYLDGASSPTPYLAGTFTPQPPLGSANSDVNSQSRQAKTTVVNSSPRTINTVKAPRSPPSVARGKKKDSHVGVESNTAGTLITWIVRFFKA